MQKIDNPIRLKVWLIEEYKDGDEQRNIYVVATTANEALDRALKLWGAVANDGSKHYTVAFNLEAQV